MANPLDNTLDTLSVEDLTNYVDEIRSRRDDVRDREAHEEWTDDNASELQELEDLLEEMKGYGGNHQWEGDWYPDYLIPEKDFTDHCQQLVDDCYDYKKHLPEFMRDCIDWDKVAKAMRVDYTEVVARGRTYLYR